MATSRQVLFITPDLPYPPDDGGRIRVFNLIKQVAKQHETWLACLIDSEEGLQYLSVLKNLCAGVEVASYERRSKLAHLPGLARSILQGEPPVSKFAHTAMLAHKITALTQAHCFSIVQVEHSFMARYIEAIVSDGKTKKLLTLHNIAPVQYLTWYRVARSPVLKARCLLNAILMARWEPMYATRFDRCITVSEQDKQKLLRSRPQLNISVIPNGVDTDYFRPLPQYSGVPRLLFVGKMSYGPCADGALYFYHNIFPLIRRVVPNAEFVVVGKNPPREVQALNADPAVVVTGYVPDIREYYRNSTLSVVPLRAGSGTRLKILESMALNRPVVSTPLGCEGLNVKDEHNILVADSPEQFAAHVIDLIRNAGLRAHLARNGRRLVESRYSWESLGRQQLALYDEVLNR